MISAILLLPGFTAMENEERRVLEGLVGSDVLVRAAIPAKVITSGVASVPTFAVLLFLLDPPEGFRESRARRDLEP